METKAIRRFVRSISCSIFRHFAVTFTGIVVTAVMILVFTPQRACALPATTLLGVDRSSWTVQVIDNVSTRFLDRVHLSLDGSGAPHVVYFDSNQFLAYGTRPSTAWSTSTVVSGITYDMCYAMSVGSAGDPRVFYATQPAGSFTPQLLNYATLSGSVWSSQTVDSTSNYLRVLRVLTDASNDSHVLYVTPSSLKYAHLSGTTVTTYTVVSATNLQPLTADIALDSSRNPHLVYSLYIATGTNQDDIYYTVGTSGVFSAGEFITSGYNSGMTAIALDPSGNPHVAFIPPSSATIGKDQSYASRAAGEWITEPMLATGDAMSGITSVVSMAIDASGRPHVVLFDGYTPQYLTKTASQWFGYILGSGGDYYGWPSQIVLDASGKPTIAFSDNFTNLAQILYAKLYSFPGSSVGPLPPTTVTNSEIPINARIYPSPFRPAAGLVTLDQMPADAEALIYTVRGVLVKKLKADATGATTWDGLDGGGRPVPTGVYWVSVKTGGRSKTYKIAVQR